MDTLSATSDLPPNTHLEAPQSAYSHRDPVSDVEMSNLDSQGAALSSSEAFKSKSTSHISGGLKENQKMAAPSQTQSTAGELLTNSQLALQAPVEKDGGNDATKENVVASTSGSAPEASKTTQSPQFSNSTTEAQLQPREGLASPPRSPTNNNSAPTSPLTRRPTGPAIGPQLDGPMVAPKDSTKAPILLISLLLVTGARHPFTIDENYLAKRNVTVADNDPVNMSVYTLKELIWKDWRDDWEIRPSSPTSIRLIHFGKLLDDKAHLKDGRFASGPSPHVVHMTIKPQEVVDDEDAKLAKTGTRDRDQDGNERSPGCRCIIL